MRRFASILFSVAMLVPVTVVVSTEGAAATDSPGAAVGPPTVDAGASHGAGLGVTGALPLHPQALETAKQRASAAARGKPGGGGGTPTSTMGWNGISDPQVTPPDTTGAIGPNSYIELVNLRYGIYTRTGTLVSTGPIEGITTGSHTCLSDPQILWDPDRQQFFYSILDTCNMTFRIGFSKTANPTAGGSAQWCQYAAFQYGSSLPDYPKLGDSRDFLMIGSNVFTNLIFTYVYDRSDVAWINKNDLSYDPGTDSCNYTGIRSGVFVGVRDAFGAPASTPVPANDVEYRDPTGYVVADPDASSQPGGVADHLSLFRVTADGTGNATLSPAIDVPVAGYSVPAAAKQPKTKKVIDTSDGRLTQAVAAADPSEGGGVAIWTQHTVFGGAGAEVRWYEIGATGAMLDHGTVSNGSYYAFNAAISPDRAVSSTSQRFGGSMALTFNTTSGSSYSAIRYVTKPAGGAQSPWPTSAVLQSNGPDVDFSCSGTCRWGDYAGASPDPTPAGTTGGTVWLANQWNVKSTTSSDVDWRTHIFSVSP
jgi:hypothetical protein